MPTFNGWNVITIPAYPPAPASIEFRQYDPVARTLSPFTGQQQIQNWGSTWMEAMVVMPPMDFAVAQDWVTFLRALEGTANVFQFTAAFMAAYPGDLGTRYWRLKENLRKWVVGTQRKYAIEFEVIEAK